MRASCILAFALLVGCPCANSPASADATAACARLAHFGCAIGTMTGCASALSIAASEHHTTSDAIACVAVADSARALVACDPAYFTCP